jgi:hypothetical protein
LPETRVWTRRSLPRKVLPIGLRGKVDISTSGSATTFFAVDHYGQLHDECL